VEDIMDGLVPRQRTVAGAGSHLTPRASRGTPAFPLLSRASPSRIRD